MADFSLWYLINAILFVLLGGGAIYKMWGRLQIDGFRDVERSRAGHYVHLCLALYSIARAVTQVLVYAGRAPQHPNLQFMLYNAPPGTLFQFLQTAMIAKWVGHANDICRILHREPLFFAPLFIRISLGMAVAGAGFTIFVLAFVGGHGDGSNESRWSSVLSAVGGTIYSLNGIVFILIGFALVKLWGPVNSDDLSATRRIFFMAFIFGGMCVIRGVLLCILAAEANVVESAASSWGTPLVINTEWLALLGSIFLASSGFVHSSNQAQIDARPLQSPAQSVRVPRGVPSLHGSPTGLSRSLQSLPRHSSNGEGYSLATPRTVVSVDEDATD